MRIFDTDRRWIGFLEKKVGVGQKIASRKSRIWEGLSHFRLKSMKIQIDWLSKRLSTAENLVLL